MSVLTPNINDFIGEINLDLNNDTNVVANFERIGTVHQKDILRAVLGDKLYNLLISDLDGSGNPVTQKYIDLVDGKTYTRPSGKQKIYEGLTRMLNYMIYSYYLEKTWSSNSSTGQLTNVNQNSEKLNRADLRKERSIIHNKAINLYNDVIIYLNDERETYFTESNDYAFWHPELKKYIGRITTGTPSNSYYYNRSSDNN